MGSWRTRKHVLVMDADGIIGIGAIRDLGAAGYTVYATSTLPRALGAHSSYCAGFAESPPYDSAAFIDWLDAFIRQHDITLIVPAAEHFLVAIRPHYDRFASLLACPGAETLYTLVDKYQLFTRFSAPDTPPALKEHLPPFALVDAAHPAPDIDQMFRTLGGPLYFKVNALSANADAPDRVARCDNADAARTLLPALRNDYRGVLVQGAAQGVGIGVFLLIWDGEVRARFMHERLHEVPHTGGVSAYRKGTWNAEIYEDALRRLQFLQWRGVAMVEYKWDRATNQFSLLEINGRLWGSLHLALKSGVGFPRLLADAHYGLLEPPLLHYREGVRCRYTFPFEVEYVRSYVRDGRIPFWRRCWCIVEFALLSLNPFVKSDLFYRRDSRLYWIQFGRTVADFVKPLLKRLTGSSARPARGQA